MKTFQNHTDLIQQLKSIAFDNGFDIFLPQGEKTLKSGPKKILFLYNHKNNTKMEENISQRGTCPFYMEFWSDSTGINYTLNSYVSQHNHPLKSDNTKKFKGNRITSPIKKTIQEFSGKFKTPQLLKDYVNKTHNIQAVYHQIYYQEQKLYAEQFGNFREDSNLLINIVRDEKNKFLCNYDFLLNNENQLTHFIYISSEMEKLYQSFSDVVVIDTTLKKNQFNMPVINFVCIDNYGSSKIIAFGLLLNEKQETFELILMRFCDMMNQKQPLIVYTDEDEQLMKGF